MLIIEKIDKLKKLHENGGYYPLEYVQLKRLLGAELEYKIELKRLEYIESFLEGRIDRVQFKKMLKHLMDSRAVYIREIRKL